MVRIMMERHHTPDPCCGREPQCIVHGGVPPPDAVLVLLLRILGVMDEHVGTLGKLEPRHPITIGLEAAAAEDRFVVREIADGSIPLGRAVSYGRSWMTHEGGADLERPD